MVISKPSSCSLMSVRISVEEDFGAGVNGVLKKASNGSAIRSLKKFLRVGISMVIIVIS